MFFLTHTDLNLIKLFIKKCVDDMKMKKKKHSEKSLPESAQEKNVYCL